MEGNGFATSNTPIENGQINVQEQRIGIVLDQLHAKIEQLNDRLQLIYTSPSRPKLEETGKVDKARLQECAHSQLAETLKTHVNTVETATYRIQEILERIDL